MTGSHRARLAFAIALVAMIGPWTAASARHYTVIHQFCKKLTCADGRYPGGAPVADQAGNLYGTAGGGAQAAGIVYALSPAPGSRNWDYRVLYNFCSEPNCLDGDGPNANLIVDVNGNLYGTTSGGGVLSNDGTVFKLKPDSTHTRWTFNILYSFCTRNDCADGRAPAGGLTYAGAQSGLPYDGVSPLYGTTTTGGGRFGGVAYSLTPQPNGDWSEKVLYSFCADGKKACTDGAVPAFQLVVDSAGNLYGNAFSGGAAANGVVFRLSPQAGEKRWQETVLHSFCSLADCVDGAQSWSGLVPDAYGRFYGTAQAGGKYQHGVLFRVTPDGKYTVVHNFCTLPLCEDGSTPLNAGGLAIDSAGNIYGTTFIGGSGGNGTVFRFDGSAVETLHSMCADACASGRLPSAGLVQGASGKWFGTTQFGGLYDSGVAFELSP
jgi:uncharacterized repeat protein (TIGR03803 family)